MNNNGLNFYNKYKGRYTLHNLKSLKSKMPANYFIFSLWRKSTQYLAHEEAHKYDLNSHESGSHSHSSSEEAK